MKSSSDPTVVKGLVLFLVLIVLKTSFAQRDMTPNKRSDAFGGPADRRELRNYGFQFSGGPAYTLTRLRNEIVHIQSESGRPVDYVIDPSGKIGLSLEVGMAIFPMKAPKIRFIKRRFFSYHDGGIGFKYLGGKETTEITNYDPTGTLIISKQFGEGMDAIDKTKGFYNGYLSAQYTAHKNYYFGEKYFIDNGIGINFDYRIVNGTRDYSGTSTVGLPGVPDQHFHQPFVAQLHYDLGLGYKIRRGSYLVPTISLPILGIAEFHGGNPALKWFSSNYYPVYFKLKYIKLLPKKKTNGCNTGSEDDRKRNKEYMQGQ
jgi:hypothetical protein